MEVIVGKRVMVIVAYVNNSRGSRVGENHHNATISDATVDLIRELHEDLGRSYRSIAEELEFTVSTVKKICTYQRRANTPQRWKRVYVDAEKYRKALR